jgi:DHA1 family bicyclomycin/chloramphenicol resistance-like MFS transporter
VPSSSAWGAAISPVVGLLGNNALAMGTVMFGGVTLAALVLLLVARPWRVVPVGEGAAAVALH